MNLVIDLGNSAAKLAIFRENEIIDHVSVGKGLTLNGLNKFARKHQNIDAAILGAVVDYPEEISEYLQNEFNAIFLDHQTPLPIRNLYRSPETLGKDRIAAVVAANALFQGQNVLVIDAGTCITYDIITSGNEYLGGSISPGLDIRLKALHNFTGKLPFVSRRPFDQLTGTTTEESILTGVQRGVVKEVEGMINDYGMKFDVLQVVLTGGDLDFFDKALKNSIFADPYLVLRGLNVILDYNVNR